MRKGTIVICVAVMLLSMWTLAFAGDNDAQKGPPNYLNITVEMTKPGVGPAHEKHEMGWPQAFNKANWPTHYLAMTSVTGPTEAWFMTGYDSAEAAEKDGDSFVKNTALRTSSEQLAQQDAQFLTGTKTMTAMYKPELSYHSGPQTVADKRYFMVAMIHVKPGHNDDFKEMRTMVKAAHEKAQLNEMYAVYQVVAGAPNPTYVIFVPMKSMKEVDGYDALHGKSYQEALGEEGQKKMRELAAACIDTADTNYFEFSPKMSYVSKEWIAANPDFWAPKMTVAEKSTKATEKKAMKKEGAQ